MKLSDITPQEKVIQIRHPDTKELMFDDNGEPATVTLVSQHSQQYQDALELAIDSRNDDLNDYEFRKIATEANIACIVDWNSDFFEMEYSPENVRSVFLSPKHPELAEQIVEVAVNTATFLPTPSGPTVRLPEEPDLA